MRTGTRRVAQVGVSPVSKRNMRGSSSPPRAGRDPTHVDHTPRVSKAMPAPVGGVPGAKETGARARWPPSAPPKPTLPRLEATAARPRPPAGPPESAASCLRREGPSDASLLAGASSSRSGCIPAARRASQRAAASSKVRSWSATSRSLPLTASGLGEAVANASEEAGKDDEAGTRGALAMTTSARGAPLMTKEEPEARLAARTMAPPRPLPRPPPPRPRPRPPAPAPAPAPLPERAMYCEPSSLMRKEASLRLERPAGSSSRMLPSPGHLDLAHKARVSASSILVREHTHHTGPTSDLSVVSARATPAGPAMR